MNSSSQEKKNKKFSSVFIYSSIIAAIVVSSVLFGLRNSIALLIQLRCGLLIIWVGITLF